MIIYPKVSIDDFSSEVEEILRKSEGIEIQFFNENGIAEEFNFEKMVRTYKERFNNLKEIVIHPPLSNYNIELIMMKNEKIVENQLKKLVQLSEELNITTTFIYHTYWTKEQFETSGLAAKLKKLLKIIEGKNAYLLIENLYMILDAKNNCPALEICKFIDHDNLRMCLDTTHMHCKANISKRDFNEMIEAILNPNDCEKYVRQIHFAAALNNDGYIDKRTHGRVHPNIEETKKEVEWLKKYKMIDKHFITEVSEDDYYTRVDQIKEIEMLNEINKNL